MAFESPDSVFEQAQKAWKTNTADHRRIVLLYALPALLFPLLIMVINLLLERQLAGTGGLSGIGLRSTLETIQTVLSSAMRLLLPFWQLGLTYCAMVICREQYVSPNHLFEGFRRWGAALRLMIFRLLRYTLGCLCGVFLGSSIYTMTPLSNKLLATSNLIASDPAYANATAEEIMSVLITQVGFWEIAPYYILCTLGAALLVIPLFYRYRMSNYILLDSPVPRALICVHESSRMMHGNSISLFKADLHLWWYYLLLFLSALVAYGDLLLPLLGVALPFSGQWSLVIFALMSTAMQFAVYYLFSGQVETFYACIYESLKAPEGGNDSL